jgi:hypothetical protein
MFTSNRVHSEEGRSEPGEFTGRPIGSQPHQPRARREGKEHGDNRYRLQTTDVKSYGKSATATATAYGELPEKVYKSSQKAESLEEAIRARTKHASISYNTTHHVTGPGN